MKIRGSHVPEKIEPQMAPMIDVVFQLLIFFMLTFKIIEPEGNFNINMPLGEATPQTQTVLTPNMKVRLLANEDGSLGQVLFGNVKLGNDEAAFERLNARVLDFIGRPGNPLMKDVEVEIDADYNLDWQYTLRAVSSVMGRMQNGTFVPYVENVKLAKPRRPADAAGGGT